MSDPAVLIVGAGPTGLNLALRLRRQGVPFRIVDEHDAPARESRALAVHARTLEFYDQLGLAQDIVARGVKVEGVVMHRDGRRIARVDLRGVGAGLSPFPVILDFPQDEHEHFLVARLRDEGVEVERSTVLTGLVQDADGVDATLRRADGGEEHVRVAYLAGCDGARSKVRAAIGADFPGGTYQHRYFVADVKLASPDGGHDFHLALGPDTFALRLPARQGEMERLIGFAPDGVEHPGFDDVRAEAEHLLDVKVASVNWFSTYRSHHRVANRFRQGRAFLLGDAGHLHSPVGGQGMNTGIGDAVNLAWKLADVVQGRAAPALLDSYEPERIAFARSLVATTDRMFTLVVTDGPAGRVMRRVLMPFAFPALTRLAAGRRAFFRLASQIRVHYPDSPLSEGRAGQVRGGDRLLWIEETDSFRPLDGMTWQLHVHGEPAGDVVHAAAELALAVHRFPWSAAAAKAGLARDTAYLIRPDGYVALAGADAAALRAYAARWGLRFAARG